MSKLFYCSMTILVGLLSCNDSEDSGSSKTRSIWPKDATSRLLDSTLVITTLSNEDIDSFAPIVRTDLVELKSYFTDAELGKTVNSATKMIQGNLLRYNFTKQELNIKPLGFVNYEFKSVTDFHDLVKKFNLDVNASFKYFSVRGNARYDRVKNSQINSYHEFIAARIYVEDREEALKEFFLKPEALELAKHDKSKFISKFGDQVITSKVIGGDLIALIEIESKNESEQESNKAHVSAAFKAWGAKASVSSNMESAINEINKTSKFSIRLIHNGVFAEPNESYTDIGSLKKLIDEFPQKIRNNGKVLEYKTSSIFSAVQDLPYNINPQDFIKIEQQTLYLSIIENKIDALYNTLPQLEYITKNPSYFNPKSVDSAKIIYKRNNQAAMIYQHNWKICATVPELCKSCLLFEYKVPNFQPEEYLSNFGSR